MYNDLRFFTPLRFVQNDRDEGAAFGMTGYEGATFEDDRDEGAAFGMTGDEDVSFRMTG